MNPLVTLAAHQPDLLPYTGFWYKVAKADLFAMLPYVDINKAGYTTRVRMRGSWASLPVLGGLRSSVRIDSLRIQRYVPDHLFSAVKGRYQGSPFWKERGEQVLALIDESRAEKLWMFNHALILGVRDMLGITTPIAVAPPSIHAGTAMIEELCCRFGMSRYMAGEGSRSYLDEAALRHSRIKVHWTAHDPWTGDSILTTLFEKEDPRAWVLREHEPPAEDSPKGVFLETRLPGEW